MISVLLQNHYIGPVRSYTVLGNNCTRKVYNFRFLSLSSVFFTDLSSSGGHLRPSVAFLFTGHVDAGKSTLMGHLLYQLGMVSKRNMHKYEQESKKVGKASFAYAWVLDETEEERWEKPCFSAL